MAIEITLPGGLAVEAQVKGFRLRTDQPEESGGSNSAPSPFDTFLASLGTCAGFYALRFCSERGIDTEGLKIIMETANGETGKKLDKVSLKIQLPPGFPDKYRRAIIRATDMCAVKQTILHPPEFETTLA